MKRKYMGFFYKLNMEMTFKGNLGKGINACINYCNSLSKQMQNLAFLLDTNERAKHVYCRQRLLILLC